jgi:hypothetical protein
MIKLKRLLLVLSKWWRVPGQSPDVPKAFALDPPSIVLSEKFFELSPEIIEALESWKTARGYIDSTEQEHRAYLLDPGLGPATYLTAEGRILWIDDGWGVEATRAFVYAAVRVGAKKTKVSQLLSLLPQAPTDASPCGECDGTGQYSAHGNLKSVSGDIIFLACMHCGTLGWVSPNLDLALQTRFG